MKNIFAFILFALTVISCHAQSIDTIKRRCPAPNGSVFASILIQGGGDTVFTPCPSGSSVFVGNVDFSSATLTGAVTGSGTVNFVPRFTAASAIGNTPLSWNGSTYTFNNTALNSNFTLNFNPTSGAGQFLAGVVGTTPFIEANQTSNLVRFGADASTANATFNAGGIVFFNATSRLQLSTPDLRLTRTLQPSGTTGGATINQMNGRVNLAAATDNVTVINSTVNANSLVIAVAQINDATCYVKSVAPTAGSFTIVMTATCTAETSVAFWVTN